MEQQLFILISIPHRQANNISLFQFNLSLITISIPHRQANNPLEPWNSTVEIAKFQFLIGRLITNCLNCLKWIVRTLFQFLIGRLITRFFLKIPYLYIIISIPHRQANNIEYGQRMEWIKFLFQFLIGRLITKISITSPVGGE